VLSLMDAPPRPAALVAGDEQQQQQQPLPQQQRQPPSPAARPLAQLNFAVHPPRRPRGLFINCLSFAWSSPLSVVSVVLAVGFVAFAIFYVILFGLRRPGNEASCLRSSRVSTFAPPN
jgi:hypothetical protein